MNKVIRVRWRYIHPMLVIHQHTGRPFARSQALGELQRDLAVGGRATGLHAKFPAQVRQQLFAAWRAAQ